MKFSGQKLHLIILLTFSILFTEISAKESVVGVPVLTSGEHVSRIVGMGIDSKKNLVTADYYGAIHIWNLPENNSKRLDKTFFYDAKARITSMALRPTENHVAIAGGSSEKHGYYWKILDLDSGEVLKVISHHRNVINSLAYSANGKYIVSAGFDRTVVVWDSNKWNDKFSIKTDYNVIKAKVFNDGNTVVWLDQEGQVFLSKNNNGHIENSVLMKIQSQGDFVINELGSEIYIVGDGKLYSFSKKNEKLATYDIKKGNVTSVSLSENKHHLLLSLATPSRIIKFDLENKSMKIANCPNGEDRCELVTKIVAKDNGGYFYGDAFGEVIDSNYLFKDSSVIENDRGIRKIGFVSKGTDVGSLVWQVGNGSLYKLSVVDDEIEGFRKLKHPPEKIVSSITKYSDLSISTGPNRKELLVTKNDNVVNTIESTSRYGYKHNAYTFIDNDSIVSGGGNGSLTQYNIRGSIEGQYVGHASSITAVIVSKNGKYLISGDVNNVIKIWSTETKKELITVYHKPDINEWVMWSPNGYYASSVNGGQLLGWIFDKGIDKSVKLVKANQISSKYYNPSVVFNSLSDIASILSVKETEIGEIPNFEIIYPKNNSRVKKDKLEIKIKKGNVDDFKIYINNKYAKNIDGRKNDIYNKVIELDQGLNKIKVVGYKDGNEVERTVKVIAQFSEKDPFLYDELNVLAIGANSGEANGINKLKYAASDAEQFLTFYEKNIESGFARNKTVLGAFTNGAVAPTKSNILKSSKKFKTRSENSLNILYLSGHGVRIDGEYYFVPDGYQRDHNGDLLVDSLVKWQHLEEKLAEAQGIRVVFIDTCYSGVEDLTSELISLSKKNIYIFSATDSGSKAYELDNIKGGAFTYAIMKALYGGSKKTTSTDIINNLDKWIPKLTNNRQNHIYQLVGQTVNIANRE